MTSKEEEITRKIELLKRKNELLLQRHKEVEEDKKSAEKSGQNFSKPSHENPSQGQKRSEKVQRGGRYQSHRAHMDEYDEKKVPDQSRESNNRRYRGRGVQQDDVPRGSSRGRGTQQDDVPGGSSRGRGTQQDDVTRGSSRGRGTQQDDVPRGSSRGRGTQQDDVPRGSSRGRGTQQDDVPRGSSRGRGTQQDDVTRGSSRGRGRGRGRPQQDYEAKRLENFRLMEEELAQGTTEEAAEPSPSPVVSRFLDDPRRRGELDPEQRWKSTRHKGSYGGLDFDNIKHEMRGRGRGGSYREHRGRGRGASKLQMSAEYTGRERRDQERWHAMREAADKEIMARSKTSEGQWRREWDQRKDTFDSLPHDDQGHSDRYDEPRRNHRGGGRGRRGRGRRGSRSSHESTENGKTPQKTDQAAPVQGEQVQETPETVLEDPEANEEIPVESRKEKQNDQDEEKSADSKPQRQRKTKNKSPRHLNQQRAQTPSSKDGTEVWAQNSHHSDEIGQDWKNGANRSAEQWLPSDEGNRNPAIDERKLEQQEDGATVYSRHLGRGWGTEKNIKATKAWVIDTEKAGDKILPPESSDKSPNNRGRNENRSDDKPNSARKGRNFKKEDTRLKAIANERSEMRSASPRLRRGHPELTVQISESGGRRVKRYSEGDKAHSLSEKIDAENKDDNNKQADESQNSIKSPLSAGALKTPEGMEYVTDWATEMELQSPTYAIRQKKLDETEASKQVNKPSTSDCVEDSKTDIQKAPQNKPEPLESTTSDATRQKNLEETEISKQINKPSTSDYVEDSKTDVQKPPQNKSESLESTTSDATSQKKLDETEASKQVNKPSTSDCVEDSKTDVQKAPQDEPEPLESTTSDATKQKNLEEAEISNQINKPSTSDCVEVEDSKTDVQKAPQNKSESLESTTSYATRQEKLDETEASKEVEPSTTSDATEQKNLEVEISNQIKPSTSDCVEVKDSKTDVQKAPQNKPEPLESITTDTAQEEEIDTHETEYTDTTENKNFEGSHAINESSEKMPVDVESLVEDGKSNLDITCNKVEEVGIQDVSTKESTDGNFKDAEEEIDDEFYECDENDDEHKDLPLDNKEKTDASEPKQETANVGDFFQTSDSKCEVSPNDPEPTTASENVLPVVEETIQQKNMAPENEEDKVS
ncbi:uncharacterized protein LOC120325842 isoform X3 [Styela clava]